MNRTSTDPAAIRARAFAIIKERSFEFGDFTLASGEKSDYYLDMKPTMFNPEGANLLAQLILMRINEIKADYVGGLEMGAVPLIAAAAVLSHGTARPVPGLFVRKGVKDHGTRKLVEAGERDLDGKRVVILEDVTTTGGSAMKAVTAVRAEGANVVLVLSIVDREEGAAEFFKKANLPFEWLFRASEFRSAL